MKATLEIQKGSLRQADLVKEWPARTRAIIRQFPYVAAREVLRELKDRIPRGHAELADSLEIARVRGLPDRSAAFVVRSTAKGRPVAEADAPSTILFVTARSNLMKRVPKSVKILEEHGPWTVDTLPFQPDASTAVVVSRKVGPRACDRVRAQRRRDRPVWRRKLNQEGIRESRKDLRLSRNRAMKTIPDVAFESVRLEFGIGGVAPKPHWRPAILKLASGGLAGMIRRNRQFSKAMTDPGYSGWRSWKPRKARSIITIQDAQSYKPFQQKLGIGAKR